MKHSATIQLEDPAREPSRDQETQPSRSRLARCAGPALLAAAFLIGFPAGCSTQEEEQLTAAGGALWSDVGDTDEASLASGSELSDDLTEKERRFLERLPLLAKIQERFEPQLFAHPGVNSIGIGLMDDGVTPVFRVAVTNPALRDILPRAVEGVAVEIRVAEPVRLLDGGPACNGGAGPPCHADQQPLPVEMGNSGAWFLGPSCTMGFKACDLTTGLSVLVTNSHCADYPNGCAPTAIGNPFEHAAPDDQMPPGSGVTIGTIAGHAAPTCDTANNYTDATKVTSAFFESSRRHRDIGDPKNEVGDPVPGWRVQYSGRTTGYNRGEIVAVNVTVLVPATGGFCCGALLMKDQVSFTPEYPVLGGDSGSGVLFDTRLRPRFDNRIAGLLFGADNTYAYFNNIHRVLSALDLTLDFTECGFPPDY